jgi:hypothetical protein
MIGPTGRPLPCGPQKTIKKNQGRALGVVPVVPIIERSFGNNDSLAFQVSSRCSRCSRSILNSTRVRGRGSHTRRKIGAGIFTYTRVASVYLLFFTGNSGNNGNSLCFQWCRRSR